MRHFSNTVPFSYQLECLSTLPVILHHFTIHPLCLPFIVLTRTYSMTSYVSSPKSSFTLGSSCYLLVSALLT
jgi:hypothetical protein